MDLQGKVAIVTGGGTGIGKEISKLLATSGAHVVVNYSRSEADALATAAVSALAWPEGHRWSTTAGEGGVILASPEKVRSSGDGDTLRPGSCRR